MFYTLLSHCQFVRERCPDLDLKCLSSKYARIRAICGREEKHMPVVTTGARGLAAWAVGPLAKGLNTLAAARKILFASANLFVHTLSMFSCGMPALEYVVAEADGSGVSGRSPAANRAANRARA
ncbi:hypothetical protein MPRS_27450 [Mycobacterium paraseoulense]|nr:hypothetical protein MPRS_27450 [Mycobacterium paraseoulense]